MSSLVDYKSKNLKFASKNILSQLLLNHNYQNTSLAAPGALAYPGVNILQNQVKLFPDGVFS